MRKRILIGILFSLGTLLGKDITAQVLKANDDHYLITQGTPFITNLDVTANDIIPPPIRPGGLILPSNVTPVATVVTDSIFNVFYLVQDTNFLGVDSFNYVICDSNGPFPVCDTAIVRVFIQPNNPPLSPVWPGDANSDGITNIYDMLSIGYAFQRNGPPRQNRGFLYGPTPAPLWPDTLQNGVNMHHADCDGSGFVNFRDTLGIFLNYGLTHPKTSGTDGDCSVDPPLFVEVISPSVLSAGDSVRLRISLGTPAIPANQAYGAALSIEYNLPVLQSQVRRNMSNSWLYGNMGGPPQAMSMVRHIDSAQRIDVAITRINQQPAMAGSGEIGTIIVIIDDNLSGKTASIEDLVFNIGSGQAVSASGQEFRICLKGDTAKIDISTGIKLLPEDPGFKLIPNPAKDELTIRWSEEGMNLLELVNLQGQTIIRKELEDQSTYKNFLDLDSIAPGVYLVRISGDRAFAIKKLIINQ